MPATIPAHPAAVLPLKLLSPRRFDGVALVVGAMAPDVAYATAGLGPQVPSHSWHSLFWFSLPVTLMIAAVVRRAAPVVAAHLPRGGPLELRDYGVLATVRHPLVVSAYSALLGAFSHLAWDTFTHPYVLILHPFGGDAMQIAALQRIAVFGLPWWRVIQLISEVLGAAVTLAVAVHIGRNRLLLTWHRPVPAVSRRPVVFWSVAGVVAAGLIAIALALPGNDVGPIGVRLIGACAVALLVAAATLTALPSPAATPGQAARTPARPPIRP